MNKDSKRARLFATAAAIGAADLPKLPEQQPKPAGYGVHLTKAERRGKTWREQQFIRRNRCG